MLTAWWTASGADTRVTPDFTSVTVTTAQPNDLWDEVKLSDVSELYQRDYHYGANSPRANAGYFYLDSDGDEITVAADCVLQPTEGGTYVDGIMPWPQDREEIRQIIEDARPGELAPPTAWHWPFCAIYDDDRYGFEMFFRSDPIGAGDHDIRHYQPWAWYGLVAEVIPSILLQHGLDEDYIDKDAFDDAYDDQVYSGNTWSTRIGYAREVGISVWEALQEIATHGVEMFGLNMSGQVCMPPRDTPTATTTALAGVKSMSWRYIDDHTYNDVRVTAGMAGLTAIGVHGDAPTEISGGEETSNADYIFRSEWDASMSSALGDRWEYSDSDAGSNSRYGAIRIGGTEINEDGPLVTSTAPTHMRFFGSLLMGAHYIANRMDQFTDALREVTAIQDLSGLDYDVGHKVTNVQITADGETIPDMRCISKEIDFDDLTVTSVLLEEAS